MRSVMISLIMLLAAAIGRCAGVGPAAFTFADEFANYPAGSDGTPVWSSESIGWETGDGMMCYRWSEKDQALVDAAPQGRQVSVQAEVTLRTALRGRIGKWPGCACGRMRGATGTWRWWKRRMARGNAILSS